MRRFYLGLSSSGHDPALALVAPSGEVVFAEATERFLQDKRAWGVAPDHPPHLERSLDAAGFERGSDELVVASSWTRAKSEVPVQVSDALLPASDGLWLRRIQGQLQAQLGASLLRLGICDDLPSIRRFDHHLCHAVMACSQSPLEDGLCVVIDGEGEVGAVSVFELRQRSLHRRWRSWGPGSLGTYYAWLTNACGFDWRLGEEWKVMGLAAFGSVRAELAESLLAMIDIEDGRPVFARPDLLEAAQAAVRRFGRRRGDDLMKAADLAATGQFVYGRMADRLLHACLGSDAQALVLTGGCALNSSYNGSLVCRGGFDTVFVPSAPADDGNAVGAALLAWMQDSQTSRVPIGTGTPFLGTRPHPRAVGNLRTHANGMRVSELGGNAAEGVAHRLADGMILGIMRGPAEFGPRALGHRSILADPRPAGMKDALNRRVKGREAYRPFAPVIPLNRVMEWFEHSVASPYMSFALPWRASRRTDVPAVVHEDGTGRLQTVCPDSAPWMQDVVTEFEKLTQVPVVLNTSFNIMGKPIVDTVEDAVAMLLTSGLDGVLVDDLLIEKPGPSP